MIGGCGLSQVPINFVSPQAVWNKIGTPQKKSATRGLAANLLSTVLGLGCLLFSSVGTGVLTVQMEASIARKRRCNAEFVPAFAALE